MLDCLKIKLRSFFIIPRLLPGTVCCALVFFSMISPLSAAICFLPDCGDKIVNNTDDGSAQKCKDEGYESYQNRVCHTYSIVDFCPYNSDYIKCNNKQWCIINEYTKTECEPPTELFNKCPNGEEMYKECKLNLEDACLEEDNTYVSACPAGWVIDPNDHCSFSDEFGHCCNTCPGFTTKEEIEAAGKTPVASCDSCDGKKYIAATDGYNSCEGYWDCQDGCAPDAKTCVSFGVTKCDKCKRCEAKCKNETCPENAVCEYEACTWRYCDPTGCKVGYTNFCRKPETQDCADLGYDTAPGACKDAMGMFSCPFDANLVVCIPDDGTCCARFCKDFDYTADMIPAGYVSTASCSCCGQTRHQIGVNPCSGYVKEEDCRFGVEDKDDSCQKGSQTLYRRCKECPNATDFEVCPEGSICKTDDCSGTYVPTGCETSYTNYCTKPITNCDTLGYSFLSGDCRADSEIMYCPYDHNFAICIPKDNQDCCRVCEANGYIYDTVPAGYTKTGECKCCEKTKYSAVMNECSGYVTDEDCEFGADPAAAICQRGEITTFAQCLECKQACDYEICPTGTVCTEDPCSGTLCPSGCQANYTYFCRQPENRCGELGYSQIDADCATKEFLRCPYDQSKVYCLKHSN